MLSPGDRFGTFPGSMIWVGDDRLVYSLGLVDYTLATHAHCIVRSNDGGITWSEPDVIEQHPGIPKTMRGASLSRLRDGRLVMILDAENDGFTIRWSIDSGVTWSASRIGGALGSVPTANRIADLDDGRLLLTTRAPKSEPGRKCVMQYVSQDQGETWEGPRVILEDPARNYTEPSTVLLQDGQLITVVRDNSYNYRPSVAITSHDRGTTWSVPEPMPLSGHELCAGELSDGRLLVLYRNAGGYASVRLWSGTPGERGYSGPPATINGLTPRLEDETLVLDPHGTGHCATYHLPPPESVASRVEICAELRCMKNDGQACGIHVADAGWVEFGPAWLSFGDSHIGCDFTSFRAVRIVREDGSIHVTVDGSTVLRVDFTPGDEIVNIGGRIRPKNINAFGTATPFAGSCDLCVEGRSEWRSVSLTIDGPENERVHWEWSAKSGSLPNAYESTRSVEIDGECGESVYFIGQPSWVEMPSGELFVVTGRQYLRDDGHRGCGLRSWRLAADDIPGSVVYSEG
jgi:hypothetical protein